MTMKTRAYDFTELDNWAERMDLIRNHDFDAYFDLMDRIDNAYNNAADEIMASARKHGCVLIRETKRADWPRWYYVHPVPGKDELRITSWDEFGPRGHNELEDSVALGNLLPHRPFTASHK